MDTNRLVPLMAVAAALSLVNAVCAADTWWVSKSRGDDSYTGEDIGTYDHPYATIQAGVDKAAHGDTVKVEAGDYDSGETYYNGSNRVYIAKKIWLKSVDGAATTRIVGKWNSADPTGTTTGSDNGDAVRCIGVETRPTSMTDTKGVGAVIEGFTLADGYNVGYGGAALYAFTQGPHVYLVDCVVSNCTGAKWSSTNGGAILNSCLVRCRVKDCGGWCIICNSSKAYNCVFTGGTVLRAVFGYSTGVNCTVKDVSGSWVQFADSSIVNVLSMGSPTSRSNGAGTYSGSLWNQSVMCVDPANEDWRLLPDAAAIGIGTAPAKPDFANAVVDIAWTDFNGAPMPAEGSVINAGAVQAFRSKATVAKFAYGGAEMSGVTEGDQWIDVDTVATFTRTATGTRNCLGIVTNGVTELFADHAGVISFTIAGNNANVTVSPVYSTDWYVNAAMPNDLGNGFTPETAKRTLADACTNMCLLAGDVVHVAAGVYNTGVCAPVSGNLIGARANVPAGVTLQADSTVDETVIEGAEATADQYDCTDARTVYKTGTNAVRCVCLGSGAKVRGFTIRGGRTFGRNEMPEAGTAHLDYCGGGVFGSTNSPYQTLVEGCVISNCVAAWGGGVAHARIRGCRLTDDYATRLGRLTLYCFEENSYLNAEKNGLGGCSAAYLTFYTYSMLNSTYVSDSQAGAFNNRAGLAPTNCVFLGKLLFESNTSAKSDHCAFLEYSSSGLVTPATIKTDTCTFLKTAAAFGLDEGHRPASTNSVVVDFCTAYHGAETDKDAAMSQRVYNGRIDCGAFEYDWRDEYTARFGAKRFTVDVASPEVVADDKYVRMTDGASLVGTWSKMGRRQIPVTVTGGGVLKAYVGDRLVGQADASKTSITYSSRTAGEQLRLVFEGDGSAALTRFRNSRGLVVVAH